VGLSQPPLLPGASPRVAPHLCAGSLSTPMQTAREIVSNPTLEVSSSESHRVATIKHNRLIYQLMQLPDRSLNVNFFRRRKRKGAGSACDQRNGLRLGNCNCQPSTVADETGLERTRRRRDLVSDSLSLCKLVQYKLFRQCAADLPVCRCGSTCLRWRSGIVKRST